MKPTPTMLLLIAASGGGKDTFLKSLDIPTGTLYTTDAFFTNKRTGEYNFQIEHIEKAHNWCFKEALMGMMVREEYIVINNTNTSMYEVGGYIRNAEAFGYNIDIVYLRCDPAVAFERNVHGTPQDAVLAQSQRAQTLYRELCFLKRAMHKDHWTIREIDTNPTPVAA